MSEHETHVYDRCPRCKSEHIEATGRMYGEDKWAVEYLYCRDCNLDFEQLYRYVSTVGNWNDEEEA